MESARVGLKAGWRPVVFWSRLSVITCAAILGVSTASLARAEGLPWLAELPTGERASAAYPAETPPQYAQRQAAFAVLVDVIEVRAGVDQKFAGAAMLERLPPAARPLWKAYVRFGYSKGLTSSNGSWQMFTNPAFRADVLAHFVPKASIIAYEHARNSIPGVAGASNVRGNWKPLAPEGQVAAPARVEGPQADAPKPAPARRLTGIAVVDDAPDLPADSSLMDVVMPHASTGLPIVGQRDAELIQDQQDAKKNNVDLGVFGLVLGEPLTAPACPTNERGGGLATVVGVMLEAYQASSAPPEGNETCRGGSFMLESKTNDGDPLPGEVQTTLQVPRSKCPDWLLAAGLSCTVVATTRNGYVTSLSFQTGNKEWQQKIGANLAQKYHAPTKTEPTKCTSRQTGVVTETGKIMTWTLPGMQVVYNPLGGGCAYSGTTTSSVGLDGQSHFLTTPGFGGAGRIRVEVLSSIHHRDAAAARHEATQPKM